MTHTLLLADDSVTVQKVIELTFAGEDVKVMAVGDGDQAIARLESGPIDIVLADVAMPGKNGYEVARHVKGSPRLSRIPVVLLTGASEPIDRARAAEVGCDGILAKPFEPRRVIDTVRDLLNRPGPPAPTTPPPVPTVMPTPSPRATGGDAIGAYFERLDAAFATLPNRLPSEKVLPAADDRPIADRSTERPLQLPIPDDVVEEIVRRVLARLSDEIERMKATIK